MVTQNESRPRPVERADTISQQSQIRSCHLRKLAVIYVRTAVRADLALSSINAQRTLVTLAHTWGWPQSRIRIIDDSGLAGTSGANRRGFQRARALIRRRQVGLVLAQDVTRLSRDPGTLAAFLADAARVGVIVRAGTEPALHDLTEGRYLAINGGEHLRLE